MWWKASRSDRFDKDADLPLARRRRRPRQIIDTKIAATVVARCTHQSLLIKIANVSLQINNLCPNPHRSVISVSNNRKFTIPFHWHASAGLAITGRRIFFEQSSLVLVSRSQTNKIRKVFFYLNWRLTHLESDFTRGGAGWSNRAARFQLSGHVFCLNLVIFFQQWPHRISTCSKPLTELAIDGVQFEIQAFKKPDTYTLNTSVQ